jgi:Tfp pilus assembly protein PilN
MIRINLLAESIGDEPQPQIAESPAAFQGRVFAIAIVAVATALSAAWWLLGVWQTRLDSQMAAAKSEANRLAGVVAENKRYESDIQEINRRIAAVQSLEDSRRGPVAFLVSLQEAVNRAPALHLLSVSPKDGRLAVNGAASSVTAVADLVAALEASQGYQDVMLREYHEDDDRSGAARFKFSLDFLFRAATPAASPTFPAKSAGPAAAGRAEPAAEKRHG